MPTTYEGENAPLGTIAYRDAVTGLPVPIDATHPMPTTLTAASLSTVRLQDGVGTALATVGGTGDANGAISFAQPSSSPLAAISAAGGAATLTIAGVASQQHRLTYLNISYGVAAPSAPTTCTVSDGTTTFTYDIPAGLGNTTLIQPLGGGIKFAAGATVTVTLGAGAATTLARINVAKLTA